MDSKKTPLGTELPEHWRLRPLGQMCTKIGSGATPKGGAAVYVKDGISFIRSQNVFDHRFSNEGLAFITENHADQLKSVAVEADDVLLNITGDGDTIARCCTAPASVLPARVNQHVVIVRPRLEDILPEYLQKYLSHPRIREYMLSHNSGGSRRALTKGQIEQFLVAVPPLPAQRAIVEVLGAIDDKIMLNEKLSNASQDLAASMFEYFIQQDLKATAVRLGDVAEVNVKKVRPKDGGYLRYVDISSVSVDKFDWPERSPWENAPGRARRGVSPGDTIWSTVRPNRKSRALVLDDDPEVVVSTGFAVLTPRKVGSALLYEAARRDEFVHYLESVAEGSAYPAVRADRFLGAPIPILSPAAMEDFEHAAMALHKRVHAARAESRILEKLRDTLMPGLLSGAIRVRDAEKVVEEAI